MFSAIIPIKKSKEQIELLPCNENTLLERKIAFLKKIGEIKEIFIASDDKSLQDKALELGVNFYLRDQKESEDFSLMVKNIAKKLKFPHIIHAPCTTPLFDEQNLKEAIKEYLLLDFSIYDSLITCVKLQSFIFDENGALNFKNSYTNSRTLPPLYELFNGCFIMSKELNIALAHQWGKVPFKHLVSKKFAFDIKDRQGFEFFKNILDKRMGK